MQAKKHLPITIKTLLAGPILTLATIASVQAQEALELEFTYVAPRQQSQVAFVPFAGDTTISPIVLNDLSKTELKPTSQNLPQQPHSSNELVGTLPIWQQTGIPYLVVGGTRTERGKILTEYEIVDLKSGRIIGGKQSLVADNNRESLRYAAHVISDKIYELITGIPGDFSGRIAYIEETGNEKNKVSQLKIMDADGENVRAITPLIEGSIFSPAWSPNGRQIAYAVQRPKGYPVIYIQDVDGGQPRLVTPYKGNNLSPSFSPDGTSLLFSSSFEGNADIYLLNIASGRLQKIIGTPSNDVQPNYAPDGNSFVYVSDHSGFNRPRIYRYSFATGQSTPISRGGYATSPQFNSDGTQIAFLNGSSAAIMNTSGAVLTNLGRTGIDESASFSPNGKRVVYASEQGGKGILNIKSLNGGASFGKSTNATIRSPVWSANPK